MSTSDIFYQDILHTEYYKTLDTLYLGHRKTSILGQIIMSVRKENNLAYMRTNGALKQLLTL